MTCSFKVETKLINPLMSEMFMAYSFTCRPIFFFLHYFYHLNKRKNQVRLNRCIPKCLILPALKILYIEEATGSVDALSLAAFQLTF